MDSSRKATSLGTKADEHSADIGNAKNLSKNKISLNNSEQRDKSTEESGYYTTSFAADVHTSSIHSWKTNESVESSMNNKMFKMNNLCSNIPNSVDESPLKHKFVLKRPWEDNEKLSSADPNTPFKKFRAEVDGGEDSSLNLTQQFNAHVDNSNLHVSQLCARFKMNCNDVIPFNPQITSTPAFKSTQTDSNSITNNSPDPVFSPPTIPTTKNIFWTEIVSLLENWYARHVDDPYATGNDLKNLTNQFQLEEKQFYLIVDMEKKQDCLRKDSSLGTKSDECSVDIEKTKTFLKTI
ncbi:hypothetical protein HELRODRAFT_162784 [Helobdella robusta]|uniref:Uncharacterized protein n=1 Tax=Helobdella robusta TaxID=6412 RepID=T1ET51_HELRO|nr:hypothetical protein HELRODRAFT_162784 [Helobdella robusta]ESN99266.1 hypothetical protein HELRODRAFT_162784 [Helobdella robusta]